jgi:uncharacterized membrane protein
LGAVLATKMTVAVSAKSPALEGVAVSTDVATRPTEHPAITAHRASRAADVQLRVADAITAFAGSMRFVYLHALLFAVWMGLFEKSPWPTLTLVVSLEAIFLSTFVMIGQNRQADFAQRKANHDFTEQETELQLNTQLTKAVHEMAQAIHAKVVTEAAGRGASPDGPPPGP